jgi:hypothetical protein
MAWPLLAGLHYSKVYKAVNQLLCLNLREFFVTVRFHAVSGQVTAIISLRNSDSKDILRKEKGMKIFHKLGTFAVASVMALALSPALLAKRAGRRNSQS